MSEEPTRLRMEWTAETVHEGLDALAKQLMMAGTGLPPQHTTLWLRPYAQAFGDLAADPEAQTHAAWMIAEKVNEMLRAANRRERLYREGRGASTWLLLTPEQALVRTEAGAALLEREPSALEGVRSKVFVYVLATLLEMTAFIAPLAFVGEWVWLAIVVAFEIAETLVVRRLAMAKRVLPIVSRSLPILALAWTAHHALAGIVLAAFVLALAMRWVFRVREQPGPP
jgi:hypothetical protein